MNEGKEWVMCLVLEIRNCETSLREYFSQVTPDGSSLQGRRSHQKFLWKIFYITLDKLHVTNIMARCKSEHYPQSADIFRGKRRNLST